MSVRQAHQSQDIKITSDGRHAFMGPVNTGDQRSCLGIGDSFLEGNNSVLNQDNDNQMSVIQSDSRNPVISSPYVQM